MKLFIKSFYTVLIRLLSKPLWGLLLISLGLMSLVYLNQTIIDLPIAIVDRDHSQASRRLTQQLDASSKIKTINYDNERSAREDINNQKLFAVIIIPNGFERRLLKNETITIPAYGDASNRLANGQVQQAVVLAYSEIFMHYQIQLMRMNGFSPTQINVILSPIKSQTIALFNSGIGFAAYVFPGLLVMLLQHSFLMASIRTNILLQISPQGKPPKAVFLGSLFALFPIWIFLSIILFVLWPWVLGYRQVASIFDIIVMIFPFLLAVLGLSKFLTECLRRVEMIYLTISFITTPVFYLSGTIWPLDSMPIWVQYIAKLLPSTWAGNMILGVNQMGLTLIDIIGDIVILLLLGCGYALLGFFIASLRSGQIRHYFPGIRKNKSMYTSV